MNMKPRPWREGFSLRLRTPRSTMSFFATFLPLLALVQQAHSQSHTSWLSRCPRTCSLAGPDPANWTYFHDLSDLTVCNQTTLLQLKTYNDVADGASDTVFRACTVSTSSTLLDKVKRQLSTLGTLGKRQFLSFNGTSTEDTKSGDALTVVSSGSESTSDGGFADAAQALSDYLRNWSENEDGFPRPVNVISRSGDTIAGIYTGSQVDAASAASVIQKFSQNPSGLSGHTVLSHCTENSTSSGVFGSCNRHAE